MPSVPMLLPMLSPTNDVQPIHGDLFMGGDKSQKRYLEEAASKKLYGEMQRDARVGRVGVGRESGENTGVVGYRVSGCEVWYVILVQVVVCLGCRSMQIAL